MPYSVGLYFDPATDDLVRQVWQNLSEAGLADYYPVSGNRPHITLALFDDTDPDRVEPILREVVESLAAFPLSFQQIGVFPGQKPVVFWAPVVTQALLRLQRGLYDQLAPFSRQPEFDFYQPGHWVPIAAWRWRLRMRKWSRISFGYAWACPAPTPRWWWKWG